MSFWPGVDKWPPPRWVWLAAAIMTFVVFPIASLFGASGAIVYGVIVAICLVLGANARLRNIGAEEFWESRPKDDEASSNQR
jgi:hypothetical protein